MTPDSGHDTDRPRDGVHAMVPRQEMSPGARRLRDTYDVTPGAPFYQEEFGYYCLERWKEQGMPQDVPKAELFGYDPPGRHNLWQMGWTTVNFVPPFEEKVLEDRGEHELVQDSAGRHVLFFKGRRSGFMPEYEDHPVKDRQSWEENVKWRMDPENPDRYAETAAMLEQAREAAAEGRIITECIIGGYMYLRSLFGPLDLMYKLNDAPDLIQDCMERWFDLADAICARHQEEVSIDELYLGEDICYNHGPLIGPEMIRRFLFPYYEQLLRNIRRRQIDPDRHLHFHLDTDGHAPAVIPLYQELGMDVMSPFEVASGCDVVEIGREYPDLVISGGVDKRELARGREAIDRLVDRIFPPMRERGGYIPTCDHGVPEEVDYEDYLYYRERCLEFAE